MKMPFGKYEGTDIEDLPRGYLLWLVSNVEFDDDDVADEISRVLEEGKFEERDGRHRH